jgi:6-phosphogluconolactonase
MRETSHDSDPRPVIEYTRREFLLTSAVAGAGLATALPSMAAADMAAQNTPQTTPYTGYVSFRGDSRISIFTMDPRTGKVTWGDRVPVDGGPDPLAMDPGKKFLYAACRDRQQIHSYRIDQRTGGLSLIGTVPLQGEPIQMVTDATGRFLLSVFFYQSTIGVHAVNGEGVVSFPPIEWRYTAYGCHGIMIDPSNRIVAVPHVARSGGPNAVAQFGFDVKTGRLTPSNPAFLQLKENEGPRHIVFHPTLDFAYSSNEQGCNATAYRVDRSAKTLTNIQNIPTVPNYKPKSQVTCSEVVVSPSGKFLFVLTREHNSITSFAIDQTSGRLTFADNVPTEGEGARPMCLDPDGRFLVAAGNGKIARMATYDVNQETGKMTPLEVLDAGNGPMWILMTRLSG